MTPDQEFKLSHSLKLLSLSYTDLASVVWDLLGESCYAFSRMIGEEALEEFQKEFDLKVVDRPIKEMMDEIAKIYVEDYGFAEDIKVEMDGEKTVKIYVKHCLGRNVCDRLVSFGVGKPFNCSIMCAYFVVLDNYGYTMRSTAEKWTEESGTIITFTNVKA
jgi:hypothetical protein